jgi:RHS repeat-associated protein
MTSLSALVRACALALLACGLVHAHASPVDPHAGHPVQISDPDGAAACICNVDLRYSAQAADEEGGLGYDYFRNYHPATGRYVQPDPIGLDGGWNRVSYVDGNPLGFVDPDGLQQIRPGRPLENQLLEGGGGGGGPTAGGPSPLGFGGGARMPPNSALVCRGGACKAESFANGSGVSRATDGSLGGVSAQCKPGATMEELARAFRHNQVGVTNVGNIRASGGRVTLDGTPGNPNHATVDGLTPAQLERLFNPTIPNPAPPARRR